MVLRCYGVGHRATPLLDESKRHSPPTPPPFSTPENYLDAANILPRVLTAPTLLL